MKTVRKMGRMGLMGLIGLISAAAALAGSPTYTTKSGAGTTNTTLLFAADPTLQIRVVGLIASSETAGSVVSFRTGGAAYLVSYTNTTATNLILTATNGIAAGDLLVIQKATGVMTSAVVHAVISSTNVELKNACPIATIPGDDVYKMGSATELPIGKATNVTIMGEALYVGELGRPVRAELTGSTATNWISTLSVRYE